MNDVSRRALMKRGAALAAGAVVLPVLESCVSASRFGGGGIAHESAGAVGPSAVPASNGWFAPAEGIRHERTWMAWPARRDVWGARLEGIRHDVAGVARAIVRFEPVSLVVRPDQAKDAAKACGSAVDISPWSTTISGSATWDRSSWSTPPQGCGARAELQRLGSQTGPRQRRDDRATGDGARGRRGRGGTVVAEVVEAPFVAEGGALELDGQGTIMATESSVVNANRNPGKTKDRLGAQICHALGARTMLWVPGVKGQDITDDNIDSLARFVEPGTIVVDQPADPSFTDVWARSEKRALKILRDAGDARGRTLHHVISRESFKIPPGTNRNLFVNVYVIWYVCNGAVILPAFADDRADHAARALIGTLYPGREPVQLRIDNLGEGGGGIHCATQQQPAV